MNDIVIRSDLRPGDLGRIISLHGTVYTEEDGYFDVGFEAYVARTIAEFIIDNAARGKVFLAERDGRLLACAAIIERPEAGRASRGQLRWVLADRIARGQGLGRRLVEMAIAHARESGWREIFLETVPGLDASMALYRKLGFVETGERRPPAWTGDSGAFFMRLALDATHARR